MEVPSFRDLSRRILLSASRSRPNVDFLVDVCDILLDCTGSDALELWLKEKEDCACWAATRKPRRFYRLGNLYPHDVETLVEEGLVWTEDARVAGALDDDGVFLSVIRVPLSAGEETVGLMVLKAEQKGYFDRRAAALCEDIGQTVAIAVNHHRVQLAQRERVKELTCLYELARTAAHNRMDLDRLLETVAVHLPPAWQYPESTAARITVDGHNVTTPGFEEGRDRQAAEIVVGGRPRGVVEVVYTQDKPEEDEGPFLVEERRLIDTVAREVAALIERREAERDRVRLEEQLRHADRLATIGQLAAGVAHELNEPLGSILGFAQLAAKQPGLPEQAERDLGRIQDASLHAREVIRKLMLFARQTEPSMRRVDLSEVVEEGFYFLESRCARDGIEVVRRLAPGLPLVTADRAQLHQVLVNLVVNALHAMEAGGTLTVETRAEPDAVCLVVSDTGCGMPDEVREKVFVPFFTTKDVGEGTGLGLPVVHGIVSAHGGGIEIESRPGQGSRFAVRLPLGGEEAERS